MMRNPAWYAAWCKMVELEWCREPRETCIGFPARRFDEKHHHIGRGLRKICIQYFSRVLLQRRRVSNDDHSSVGEHWKRGERCIERFCVELRPSPDLHVEVSHRRLDCRRNELLHSIFLLEIIFA